MAAGNRRSRGARDLRRRLGEAQASWAGLAHDVSNLLQTALGNGERLREQLRAGGCAADVIQTLDGVLLAGELAGCWMRQAALRSRNGEPSSPSTDLNAALREMEGVLRSAVGRAIRMSFKYAAGPVWARTDAVEVGRVILNLVLNARDAMAAGGIVTLLVDEVLAREARTSGSGRRGAWGRITVSDTGPAVDNLENVFGHTTKSGHLGLGLPTARSLAGARGGFIEFTSAPGGGARVSVCFPSALAAVNDPSSVPTSRDTLSPRESAGSVVMSSPSLQGRGRGSLSFPAPFPPGEGGRRAQDKLRRTGEGCRPKFSGLDGRKLSVAKSCSVTEADRKRILVVEDDPLVREILCRTLASAGYRVLEASDAAEALRLYDREPRPIDLLITDVHLERISGPRLAHLLRAKEPHLRILYATGYPEEGLASRREAFLPKPFKPTAFLRKVEEMLEAE